MRDQTSSRYWFPAKRYGWGWGLPRAWQGWVVLAAFLALLVLASVAFPPRVNLLAFAASVVALCAVLIAVCFTKGEPPTWRWGK